MDDWRDRLMAAVSPLEAGVGKLRINGLHPSGAEPSRPNRTAAVLVPLLDLPEPELVLTRRAEHLPQHAGQVSFPGGGAEKGDDSAVQTALREAHEEIGLPPAVVRPIGFLDRMDTISDYRVLPVVALVTEPVEWIPDLREVAEVFTLPLRVALDESRYQKLHVKRDGAEYTIYSLDWRGYRVWGATASIIINLKSRMEAIDEH
jgi:8-oxo-dGTP pyrophosphatase MutT (NUDIX family)